MIYFTADLHIGHTNIIKHCSRPFVSVEEMDDTLLCSWNEKVNIGDTIYVLGDFFFRNIKSAREYLQQMNGKKRLIIGNHDKEWMKKVDLFQYFEEVEQMKIFSDGSHKITLCHYPLMTWESICRDY